MFLRSPCIGLAIVACTLAVGVRPAPALAAEPQRLMLIDGVTGPSLSAAGRERLRREIADVAGRNGFALAPNAALPERLQHCELPACLPQIAAASGAMLVLAVNGHFAKESFKLTVALWNADESSLVAKDTRDCPICDEQDLWGTAVLVSQGLFERYARRGQVESGAKGAPASPSPASSSADHADSDGKGAFYTGLGLVAAGLVTLAMGTYYIAEDGKATCERCDHVRDTRKVGLPLAIVGGLAAVGGGALLSWSLWSSDTQVSLGITGIQLAGRFQ